MSCVICVDAKYYDWILDSVIEKKGVFDGEKGVVFADYKKIGNFYGLVVISIENSIISCMFYPEENEIQFEELSFPYKGNSSYVLSLATMGNGNDCYVLDIDDERKVYAYVGNNIEIVYDAAVYDEIKIVECNSYGIICHKNPKDIYELVNSEKLKRISASSFTDCKDEMNSEKLAKIKSTIEATADVVTFDINNYDYVQLMKNILYTSNNYEIISEIPRDYIAQYGGGEYERIHSVNAEFIDFVLLNIFGIAPNRLEVKNLADNGFCYVNGRYYYIGGYTDYFSTSIEDIISVYDLGEDRYYVVFSDYYYENETTVPELGYAIIDTKDKHYKLVNLSVGKKLLSDNEIKGYSKSKGNGLLFINNGDPILYIEERKYMINILMGVSIVAVCVAGMALIFGIVIRRK